MRGFRVHLAKSLKNKKPSWLEMSSYYDDQRDKVVADVLSQDIKLSMNPDLTNFMQNNVPFDLWKSFILWWQGEGILDVANRLEEIAKAKKKEGVLGGEAFDDVIRMIQDAPDELAKWDEELGPIKGTEPLLSEKPVNGLDYVVLPGGSQGTPSYYYIPLRELDKNGLPKGEFLFNMLNQIHQMSDFEEAKQTDEPIDPKSKKKALQGFSFAGGVDYTDPDDPDQVVKRYTTGYTPVTRPEHIKNAILKPLLQMSTNNVAMAQGELPLHQVTLPQSGSQREKGKTTKVPNVNMFNKGKNLSDYIDPNKITEIDSDDFGELYGVESYFPNIKRINPKIITKPIKDFEEEMAAKGWNWSAIGREKKGIEPPASPTGTVKRAGKQMPLSKGVHQLSVPAGTKVTMNNNLITTDEELVFDKKDVDLEDGEYSINLNGNLYVIDERDVKKHGWSQPDWSILFEKDEEGNFKFLEEAPDHIENGINPIIFPGGSFASEDKVFTVPKTAKDIKIIDLSTGQELSPEEIEEEAEVDDKKEYTFTDSERKKSEGPKMVFVQDGLKFKIPARAVKSKDNEFNIGTFTPTSQAYEAFPAVQEKSNDRWQEFIKGIRQKKFADKVNDTGYEIRSIMKGVGAAIAHMSNEMGNFRDQSGLSQEDIYANTLQDMQMRYSRSNDFLYGKGGYKDKQKLDQAQDQEQTTYFIPQGTESTVTDLKGKKIHQNYITPKDNVFKDTDMISDNAPLYGFKQGEFILWVPEPADGFESEVDNESLQSEYEAGARFRVNKAKSIATSYIQKELKRKRQEEKTELKGGAEGQTFDRLAQMTQSDTEREAMGLGKGGVGRGSREKVIGKKQEFEGEATNFANKIWSHYLSGYDVKPSDEAPFDPEELNALRGQPPEEIEKWLSQNQQTRYKIAKGTPYIKYYKEKKQRLKAKNDIYFDPKETGKADGDLLIRRPHNQMIRVPQSHVSSVTGFDANEITNKHLHMPNYNWGIPNKAIREEITQKLAQMGIKGPMSRDIGGKETALDQAFVRQLQDKQTDLQNSLSPEEIKSIGSLESNLQANTARAMENARKPEEFLYTIDALLNEPENFIHKTPEDLEDTYEKAGKTFTTSQLVRYEDMYKGLAGLDLFNTYRSLTNIYDKIDGDVDEEAAKAIKSGIVMGLQRRVVGGGIAEKKLIDNLQNNEDYHFILGQILGDDWKRSINIALQKAIEQDPRLSQTPEPELKPEPIQLPQPMPEPEKPSVHALPMPRHLRMVPPEREGEPFVPIPGQQTGTGQQESFQSYCNKRNLMELAGGGPAIYGAVKKSPDFNWWGAPESMIKPKRKHMAGGAGAPAVPGQTYWGAPPTKGGNLWQKIKNRSSTQK